MPCAESWDNWLSRYHFLPILSAFLNSFTKKCLCILVYLETEKKNLNFVKKNLICVQLEIFYILFIFLLAGLDTKFSIPA